MTRDAERGLRFVVGMVAVLCAVCGLAALFGVPAAGGIFFNLGGVLLGIGAAWALLPRRDWGLAGRTVLMLIAIGGIFAGYRFSVLDFSTVRGTFFWGLYLGFWFVAASRLTGPVSLEAAGMMERPRLLAGGGRRGGARGRRGGETRRC